jgi:hypothetical protein
MRFLAKKRTLKMLLNMFAGWDLTMMAHLIKVDTAALPKKTLN